MHTTRHKWLLVAVLALLGLGLIWRFAPARLQIMEGLFSRDGEQACRHDRNLPRNAAQSAHEGSPCPRDETGKAAASRLQAMRPAKDTVSAAPTWPNSNINEGQPRSAGKQEAGAEPQFSGEPPPSKNDRAGDDPTGNDVRLRPAVGSLPEVWR